MLRTYSNPNFAKLVSRRYLTFKLVLCNHLQFNFYACFPYHSYGMSFVKFPSRCYDTFFGITIRFDARARAQKKKKKEEMISNPECRYIKVNMVSNIKVDMVDRARYNSVNHPVKMYDLIYNFSPRNESFERRRTHNVTKPVVALARFLLIIFGPTTRSTWNNLGKKANDDVLEENTRR